MLSLSKHGVGVFSSLPTPGERIVHRGDDLVDRNLLITVGVTRFAVGQHAGTQHHVHQRNDFIHGYVTAGVAVAATAGCR